MKHEEWTKEAIRKLTNFNPYGSDSSWIDRSQHQEALYLIDNNEILFVSLPDDSHFGVLFFDNHRAIIVEDLLMDDSDIAQGSVCNWQPENFAPSLKNPLWGNRAMDAYMDYVTHKILLEENTDE